MMAKLKHIYTTCITTFLFILAALLIGCMKEGDMENGGGCNNELKNFEITTRATVNNDDNAQTGEDKIFSAVVYIFQAGTDILDNRESLEVNTSTSIGEVVDNNGKLNKMWRVPVGTKDVYVIANPDTELKVRLTNTLTQAQLKEILTSSSQSDFAAFVNNIPSKGVLMSGIKTNVAVSPEFATVNENIPVTRRCARINFMLRKAKDLEGINVVVKSVKYKDQVYQGSVYSVSTPPTAATAQNKEGLNIIVQAQQSVSNQWSGTNSDYTAITNFYTFERAVATNAACLEMIVSIGGAEKTLNVYLCSTSIGTGATGNDIDKPIALEPNHIYYVMGTLSRQSTDITLNILDWNDANVNGDINGTTLAVSQSKILMDWWNFGESFSTTLNVTASEKISFIGYEHDGDTDKTGACLPDWLPIANITGITDGTATTETIGLTYVLNNATFKYPVYLWFKAGNIKKRVEIVYDNGYVPAELLIARGWTNAPAKGIQWAKIGNNTPETLITSTTVDAWVSTWTNKGISTISSLLESTLDDFRQPDALLDTWKLLSVPFTDLLSHNPAPTFGNGPANTLVMIASQTDSPIPAAFQNLGSRWYLPSIGEMAVVGQCYKYLGVSYAFNTGYYAVSSTCHFPNTVNNVNYVSINSQALYDIGGEDGEGIEEFTTLRAITNVE